MINLVHNERQRGSEINKYDLAASFQEVAIEQLIRKTKEAILKTGSKRLIIAGGVSANKYLRKEMEKLANEYNINLSIPKMRYCTDNATMIAAAAYPLYLKKDFATYDLNPISTDKLFTI